MHSVYRRRETAELYADTVAASKLIGRGTLRGVLAVMLTTTPREAKIGGVSWFTLDTTLTSDITLDVKRNFRAYEPRQQITA